MTTFMWVFMFLVTPTEGAASPLDYEYTQLGTAHVAEFDSLAKCQLEMAIYNEESELFSMYDGQWIMSMAQCDNEEVEL